MPQKRAIIAGLLILFALSFTGTARATGMVADGLRATAQTAPPAPAGSAALLPQQGPTDPAELEAFLDELMAQDMEEHHIAGAAVSVVKDGELFFAKGYGFADLENGIPVDPERTLFRIGSVTKLFTWTAVMQLVDQGKLDLDADINSYLDFHIPDTYPQPITLKHLLTHTAGFEDLFLDFVRSESDDLVSWRDWMISHMPARVRPPGECAAYSNYGASLAGYIVARVSGQPYEQYIQEHILNPLGMVYTSAQMPIPPHLRERETVGYMYADGAFQVFPDLLGQWMSVPMGGMRASAADIARFMIAHLQNGRYGDANIAETHILQESTAQQMHSTLFTHDPRLLGTTYGFFDFSDSGQRTLGHSGGSEPMNSLLLLLPDQNLGVFVTYNSMGSEVLVNQHLGFQRAFFDHYYSAPAVGPIEPPADFAQRASRFVGSYRMTAKMGSYTTLEKVKVLMGGTVAISDPGDGGLLLTTPWMELRLVEVEPLYFRQADGPYSIVFREDERGRVTDMFSDITPMLAFEKLHWYETAGFNMVLFLVCVLIFLSAIPVVVIGLLQDRRRSSERDRMPRGAHRARWIALGICVLNVLFVVGTYLWGEQNLAPVYGVTLIYRVVLGLGVLSAALTGGALVYTALGWRNSYWGIAARVYYTLVTLAAVAFVWFLNTWNLLGWRY